MIRSNATYDALNAAINKKPVVVLTITGMTTYFSSGTFSGITTDYKKLIKSARISHMKLEPLDFRTNFGTASIELTEDGTTLIGLFNSDDFVGAAATIKLGFQELAIGNFVTFSNYVIDWIDFDSRKRIYKISLVDQWQKMLERPFLKNLAESYTTEVLDVAEGEATLNDVTYFTAGGAAPWSTDGATFAMIENELRGYDNIAAGALEYTGAQEVAHVSGVGVREIAIAYNEGTTILVWLLQMLTTTAAGTNGDWDLTLDGFGPAIDIDLIDFHQMANEIGSYGKIADSTEAFYIQMYPEKSLVGHDNFLRYCDDWILRRLPAYFIKTPDNKLGLKLFDVFSAGEGMLDLDDDDIMEAKCIFNYDNILSKLTEKVTEIRAWNSIDRFEFSVIERSFSEITDLFPNAKELDLIWDAWNGDGDKPHDTLKAHVRERYFWPYANPEVRVEADLLYKYHLVQSGDLINLSSSYLPNVAGGNYTWTDQACLVLGNEITIDEDGAACSMILKNIETIEKANILNVHYWDDADLLALVGTGDAKQTITYNVDEDAGLDAEDGYMDQTVYTATDVMVKLEITPPGEALGVDFQYIEIKVALQDPTGTNVKDQTRRVYYDERSSDKFYVEFYVRDAAGTNFDRIKVDWMGAAEQSGTYPPSSVKLVGVKFVYPQALIDSNTVKSG